MADLNNTTPLSLPYYQYVRLGGSALFNAKIYVGIAETDPTNTDNQIDVLAIGAGGATTVLDQPIRTNTEGYAVDDIGNIVYPVVSDDYSITVNDQNDVTIYEESTVFINPSESLVTTINTLPVTVTKGQTVINIPDKPNSINLFIPLAQEPNFDFTYNKVTGDAVVDVPFTGNEQVWVQYGAIVAVTATKPSGVLSFGNVSQYVADVNNTAGDKVFTYFYNAEVLCEWVTVAAGTGAGDMSDGTLNLTGTGLQGKLVINETMTPKHFGAFGGGTLDDTTAVNNCCDNSKNTIIDVDYGVTETVINNSINCVNGASLRYIGETTDPIARVVTLNSDFVNIEIDAGSKEAIGVILPDTETLIVKGQSITVKNIIQQQSGSQGQAVGVFNPGCRFLCEDMYFQNLLYETEVGYAGGGTQGFVTSFTGVSDVNNIHADESLSIVLADQNGSVTFGNLHSYKCFAQPIYNLDGQIKGGTVYADECFEEVIVNQGWTDIDEVVATGRTFAILRLRASCYTSIGRINGGPSRSFSNTNRAEGAPKSITPEVLSQNIPRGILSHRTNNAGFINGPVYIGNVTGDFSGALFTTGFGTGETESLVVGDVDVNLYYDADDASLSTTNWFNLIGVQETNFTNCNIKIIEFRDNGALTFSDQWYDASNPAVKPGYCGKMDVYVFGSDETTYSTSQFQGQRPSENMRFEPQNHVWNLNFGSPRLGANLGARGNTIIGMAPVQGYWIKGDRFLNEDWGDGGGTTTEFGYKCTVTGEPGTWVTITI